MANEELYHLVDDYLNNRLSEEDRQAFEKKCEEDADFALEVKLQIHAEYVSRAYTREERKVAFNAEFDRLEPSAGKVVITPLYRMLGIAAVIVVLIGMIWLFRPKEKISHDQLFSDNIGRIHPLSPYRTKDTSEYVPESWKAAAAAFNSGEYEKAISLMEITLQDTAFQSRSKAYLYLGISHMLLLDQDQSHFEAAVRAFDQVDEGSSSIQKALWYKALAYLKNNRYPEAKQALAEVKSYPGHYRKAQADSLIQILE